MMTTQYYRPVYIITNNRKFFLPVNGIVSHNGHFSVYFQDIANMIYGTCSKKETCIQTKLIIYVKAECIHK